MKEKKKKKKQNYVVMLPNKCPAHIFHGSQSNQLPSKTGPSD